MKRVALVIVLLGLAAPAAAEPRKITLEEAISLATEGNVQIEAGKEMVIAGEAKVRGTKTYRLPSLSLSANVFVWNEKIEFAIGPPMPGVDNTITARSQLTSTVDVSIVQPITTALLLGTLLDFEKAQVDASRADLDVKRLDVAYATAEAYITVLQLGTLREVAQVSVTQLEANLVQAKALKDAGLMFDVDLLRIEAQIAAMQQQVLEAESGAEIARRALAVQLGLPDGTELELAPVDTTPPVVAWTEEDAVALARKQRPEHKAADAQVEVTEKAVDLAKGEYLPTVNLVGSYQHAEGQGAFAIKDSAFVGLTLQWNIWDWGARRAKVDEARAYVRGAKKGREALEDAVALDVRAQWITATTKRKTLDVAESGLKAAEEAHRLQNVRFAGGAGTTTEVIDAEAEVSRARSQATIARYQYLVSWMALVRAVGELPDMPRSP